MFFLSTRSLSVPMLVFRSVVLLPVRCTYIWVVYGVNVGTLILFNDSLLMFGGQCRDNLIESTYIQLRFWKSCIWKCAQLYWGPKVKRAVFFIYGILSSNVKLGFGKLVPFLPKSWKWKITFNERKLILDMYWTHFPLP